MPSFDTVLEPDLVEVRNAVDQASREIGTRFDFKGSGAKVELADQGGGKRQLVLWGDSDFQLGQVKDLVLTRMAKRGVDVRFLDFSAKPQKMGGDRQRQEVPVVAGIDAATAKRIQSAVKASKLKVQAAIQGETVRISGAKRDELQAAIALLRKEVAELPLGFENFRD
jgi:uncharacterized protein YajQ (UPF0234 family)